MQMIKKQNQIYKTVKGEIKLENGKPIYKEDYIHKQCVKWFYETYGDFRTDFNIPMLIHNANETPAKSNLLGYHRKMKLMGKIAGFADFSLYNPKTQTFILIELKASDVKKLIGDQLYNYNYFNYQKEISFIVNKLEDFVKVVQDFLD